MSRQRHTKLIAVIGSTGQQGGGVVGASASQRPIQGTRPEPHPGKHRDLGDEVVKADLDRPETFMLH